MTYIGIIIGAGFASGQEMLQFFIKNGPHSFWGVLLCGLLFGLVAFLVLEKIRTSRIDTAASYFGGGGFALLTHILMALFLFCSYIVMTAACGAFFSEILGAPKWLGIVLFSAFCLIVFLKDAQGIIAVNIVLTPLMVVGITILGVLFLTRTPVPSAAIQPVTLSDEGIWHWFFPSLLYASYNVLPCVMILSALRNQIKTRLTSVLVGVVSTLALTGIAVIMWLILWRTQDFSASAELPMMASLGKNLGLFYIPLMFMAIITTAVSSGFGVIHSFGKHKIPIIIRILLVVILGGALGFFGFSQLVAKLYTAFGWLGLFVMGYIIRDGFLHGFALKNPVKNMRKKSRDFSSVKTS
ncbi:MAG: hypothetical protein LBL34_05865 [Clostridiales bacterium]|nr:hypothetical protein [Clostridiales bacterium]